MEFEREREIRKASWAGIVGNGLLAIIKIITGVFAGSLAVVADGIDSMSDIFTSVITLITARILSRPPDVQFPYGYGKADTLATKALSFIIFFAGAQLAITTVRKLVHGSVTDIPSFSAIVVTAISIAGKLILARHHQRVGKRTGSDMLIANARNMQNDVLISGAVLTGLIFTFVLKIPLIDPIAALVVSIWILKVAYQIFMQTNLDLMDGIQDCSIYNDIFSAIESVEGAYNPHRVRARKIGNKIMVAVDLEVEGDISIKHAHNIAHNVELSIKQKIANIFDVVIHLEPLGDKTSEKKFGLSRKDFPGNT